MKGKRQMPGYYGKNIVQHAQKKFFQRKALEVDQKKRQERLTETVENGKKE